MIRLQKLLSLLLAVLLLAGCMSQEEPPAQTQPPLTTPPTVETTVATEPEAVPLPPAQRIPDGFSLFMQERDVTQYVVDDNVGSKVIVRIEVHHKRMLHHPTFKHFNLSPRATPFQRKSHSSHTQGHPQTTQPIPHCPHCHPLY